MAQERLSNLGYLALAKETTKGTAATMSTADFAPLYSESMNTDANFVEDNPIMGNKYGRFQVLPGQRQHKGSVTVMAEPNTSGRIVDMILAKGTTTGANPYTHPFTLSATTNPNSYTVDISTGNLVKRFGGVEANKLELAFNKNEGQWNLDISALWSFLGAQISSVSGSGPYTINLDTGRGPTPTQGLNIGDLIRFYDVSAQTSIDATIATVSATSFTTTTNPTAITTGDFVYLRPQTQTFSTLVQTPFLYSSMQLRFGTTAASAFSATPVRVENTSGFTIAHDFEDAGGSARSGSLDPASLVRTQGDVSLKVKRFFDTPEDIQNFNQLTKSACVVSLYAGSTNQYEFRLTFNHLKTDGKPLGELGTANIIYSELDYKPQMDVTDGQAFDVKVINALATV